jgi:hypothetical protein
VVIIAISLYVLPPIRQSYTENNDLNQPRTFTIYLQENLNGSMIVMANATADMQITLTFHYPHGTLVVDDPVKVDGEVYFSDYALSQNVASITLAFDSAQSAPDLILNHGSFMQPNIRLGNETFFWSLEGTHSISLAVTYMDWHTASPFLLENPKITVYPKAESAQIVNNTTSTVLTVAIYGLTLIGTVDIFMGLWRRAKPIS